MSKKSAAAAEKALRESAQKFREDLLAAKEAGLDVAWPGRADELTALQISTTGKALEEEEIKEIAAAETKVAGGQART